METLSRDDERQTWGCLPLIKSLNEGLGVLFVVHVFRIVLMGARTVHMDDYDECEWSLCSPYALLLSLSWYGRGSFFEVQARIMLLLRCSLRDGQQVPGASIPHGGSFDLFHENPKYCGWWKTHRAIVLSTFHESPVA